MKLSSKAHVCTDFIPSSSPFNASVFSNRNSGFSFTKWKPKRKLRKLQTDSAIAEQEAAITVLELKDRTKTLSEGKPAPRGQYYHVTVAHWPILLSDSTVIGIKTRGRAMVPGSILVPQQHEGHHATSFCRKRDGTQITSPRLGSHLP